jgi:metallo-beta-lactamase family protein
VDGADIVKIHGHDVPVAAKVIQLDSMSAHADRDEILRWLGYFTQPPQITYLVHGEPGAMSALKDTIDTRLGWHTHMPALGETVTLPVPAPRAAETSNARP